MGQPETPETPKPLEGAEGARSAVQPVVIRRYYWAQCYELDDGKHWALCDDVSDQGNRISDLYLVLEANYPTSMYGRPISEEPMLARIVRLLNEDEQRKAAG